MDLEKLRDRVTSEVCKAVPAELSAETKAEITRIVGAALLETTGAMHGKSKEAVVFCCGPEADLAHKIQHSLDQQRDMLVANLMAMR